MDNNVKVNIIRLEHNISIPVYATDGAAGMDITSANKEPVTLNPLERSLIPTGFIIELPKGYEAQIRPRSGMSIKHGITLVNCVGTVDEDYRGEVCVPVINLSNETYTINTGDRIAQMVIAPVTKAKLLEVQEVGATNRASGGFGSTGY